MPQKGIFALTSDAAFRDQIDGSVPATLGGALHLARSLPQPAGRQLAEASHAAFAHSLHVAALVAACVSLGVAILTAAIVNRTRLQEA